MIQEISIQIFMFLLGIILILSGYIWKTLSNRIKCLETIQAGRPCHLIAKDIEIIKTNIEWIKKTIDENKWQN